MTYEESRAYIETLKSAGMQMGLARMEQVMSALGNPERSLKTVHIAGTNGKGSVAAMVRCMLTAAGYRVGAYTSPAVTGLRDTITISGAPISKADFAVMATAVHEAMPQGLSEFEFVTAMTLLYFAQQNTDLCVVECGLGGAMDATNVLPAPLCAVLTAMGLDHTAILGDTMEEIAAQKAGICKSPCAVVCAPDMDAAALGVILQHAAQNGLTVSQPHTAAAPITSLSADGTVFTYAGETYRTPMIGTHQRDNALTALTVADALEKSGFALPLQARRDGIAAAYLPCRQELCHKQPLLLLDGAHNPQGAQALADTIRMLTDEKVTLVVGMLRDKDAIAYAEILAPLCSKVLCCTPQSERALPATHLAKIFAARGLTAEVFATPTKAYQHGLHATAFPMVVCGSFYTAAPVRKLIVADKK